VIAGTLIPGPHPLGSIHKESICVIPIQMLLNGGLESRRSLWRENIVIDGKPLAIVLAHVLIVDHSGGRKRIVKLSPCSCHDLRGLSVDTQSQLLLNLLVL